MFVCNREVYGFLPVPLRSHSTLRDEAESFLHVQLEIMGEQRGPGLTPSASVPGSSGLSQLGSGHGPPWLLGGSGRSWASRVSPSFPPRSEAPAGGAVPTRLGPPQGP